MKFLVLYFLAGSIVAVWTAINQNMTASDSGSAADADSVSYIPAYIMIGLAWPVSVLVSIYSVVQGLLTGEF